MQLIILDTVTSIIQSILFVYVIDYCVEEQRNSKIKLILMVLAFIGISQFLVTGTFANNQLIAVILPHVLGIVLLLALFKKNIIQALTAYTIVYLILLIFNVIIANLVFECVKEIIPAKFMVCEEIFIIYIPEWIILFICYKCINKIKETYKLILYERFTTIILIMSFVLDFILTFYLMKLSNKSQLMENIVYILFFILFIAISVYFWKIRQKSEQIKKLNLALENRNNELRKFKHDYGAQISYLYMLCLMDRFDDLKKSLKNIIDNNQSTPTAVEVSENKDSMLAHALKSAIDQGIHVIIEEGCDVALVDIDGMEFYRVVSNIVNNAIKAMNGTGIIIAKTYEYLGNAVIKIENNGPKIPEQYLNRIFDAGFTTKDNSDKSHGYGLNIVKDIVESYNGKIYVKSTDVATQFKIVLPIK